MYVCVYTVHMSYNIQSIYEYYLAWPAMLFKTALRRWCAL